MKKKMTPKQRVLKKYPDAYSSVSAGGIVTIYPFPIHGYSNSIVSSGEGARSAWADAARKLHV